MAKKSRFIGVRLHPDNDYENRALEIFDGLVKEGYSPRQIFTDAILRLTKHKPEMFADFANQVTKPYLEAILSDFAREIIQAMGERVVIQSSPSEYETGITEDEDTDYAKNLAANFLNRRKR